MDDRDAVRTIIAEARRKVGKSSTTSLKKAVREGMLEALQEWSPATEPEPVKFDALDPSVSADAMRKLFPDADPLLFRDRVPGTLRPATIEPISETERVRMAKRAETIEAGA